MEDNAGDARLIQEWLSEARESFSVRRVERLSEALKALAEERFDLVLLDLSLPDAKGIDTFIRFHASAPGVPVVVLTGLRDEATGVHAVQAGAQDYLVKGDVDGNTLARAIRHGIERNKAILELERRTHELETSRAQMRQIVEKTTDGILVVDRGGTIRFANPAAEQLYKRWAEELVGRPFDVPEPRVETGHATIRRSTGESIVVEMRSVEIDWEGEPAKLILLRKAALA